MKLRNKKTGEIRELIVREDDAKLYDDSGVFYKMVGSLADLNEEWKDYKPAEPLIKDEKIRKAVRAWAEANKFSIFVIRNKHYNTSEIRGLTDIGDANGCSICFKGTISKANNITYTIAELCGENDE